MNKCELIGWLATLPDDDPRLAAVARICCGVADEPTRDAGRALTITEAARRSGLTRPVLYRALRAGALRAFKAHPLANQKITEGELARWLSGRKGAV